MLSLEEFTGSPGSSSKLPTLKYAELTHQKQAALARRFRRFGVAMMPYGGRNRAALVVVRGQHTAAVPWPILEPRAGLSDVP